MNDHAITYIGKTNFRNSNQKFGIKDQDRLQHLYVIGKSGTGKSTLLKQMALSDIHRGNGLCVIDPHGDVAKELLQQIPESRKTDLIYFDATSKNPLAFNPLYNIPQNYHHLVAAGLISTFKKIWADSWGPRLEYILRFSLLTLMHYPNATLLDIQPLLTNHIFRNNILGYVVDGHIQAFWKDEFEKYFATLKAEAIAPILNKVGLFATSLPLRNIVGQQVSSFKMQQVLDNKKILIVNLSKGQIGEDASSLLGSMLISSIQLAALHRAAIAEDSRIPFYVYIDEAHSFLTQAFIGILSESRKFKLSLYITHQYMEQMPNEIRSAIFGNVGTIISFRIGVDDAVILAKEFYPIFNEEDLVNLPRFAMYLKLMIDGSVSKPFSANTIFL
ncbi:MAG: hypothetical protein RJA07_931 [Bacteroidota bacterium]|jgi:energy-coupling factor transporter ATP-binding protein EcfA2